MKYTEEQIDAYLRGEISVREKAAFEAEMKKDPALAREVRLMRDIISSLKGRQEKEEAISAWLVEAEDRKHERRGWVPWVTAFSSAAAILAGVFLLSPRYYYAPHYPSELDYSYDEYRSPDEEVGAVESRPHMGFRGLGSSDIEYSMKRNKEEALKKIEEEIKRLEREIDMNKYIIRQLQKQREEILRRRETE